VRKEEDKGQRSPLARSCLITITRKENPTEHREDHSVFGKVYIGGRLEKGLSKEKIIIKYEKKKKKKKKKGPRWEEGYAASRTPTGEEK